jgi:hypothetical protein
LHELDRQIHEIRQARAGLQRTIDAPYEQLDDCPVHRRILRAHAEALATAARTAAHHVSAMAGGETERLAAGRTRDQA